LIAVVVVAGAAYLASPAITDWIRPAGGGAATNSPSPSAGPSATPAPTAATSGRSSTAPGSPIAPRSPTATATSTPTPTATPQVHVVVKGETLSGIAAQYGVTVAAIQDANGITDTSLIFVGERLVIPSP
jgi:LysM repeat protein